VQSQGQRLSAGVVLQSTVKVASVLEAELATATDAAASGQLSAAGCPAKAQAKAEFNFPCLKRIFFS